MIEMIISSQCMAVDDKQAALDIFSTDLQQPFYTELHVPSP